jgi:L-iditol 2-dehydrogenase
MKAAVLKGIKNIVIEEYPLRKLEKEELLIKVASCGVCGTDKHIFEGKASSSIPIILGHEYSGIVADKSSSNQKLSVGDKVVIDPNIHCGYCSYCRRGQVNFCSNLKALGVTLNGGFAEYSIVPDSQAFVLPKDYSLDYAAFAEPVSCCLRAIDNASIKSGETVVVVGGGTIGQLMVQLTKISGALKVILVEPVKFKRELGFKLGADYVLDPNEEKFIEHYNEITKIDTDVIIECVGNKEAVDLSLSLAGKGSRVVLFGLAPKDHFISVNLQYLLLNEIKIISSLLNPYTFNNSVELLTSGRLDIKPLISKQFSLREINSVFNNNSNIVKCQIINNFKEAA